ncbi:hypothetical protein [Croceibacterium ferulae]|uniref:hypothetical protein n=1 Tax=Croceibacterium ferulae TaxID=1854641 RepID=UPI0012D7C8C1|nr:hypothetical protein [Croceibacterium ferulae]
MSRHLRTLRLLLPFITFTLPLAQSAFAQAIMPDASVMDQGGIAHPAALDATLILLG